MKNELQSNKRSGECSSDGGLRPEDVPELLEVTVQKVVKRSLGGDCYGFTLHFSGLEKPLIASFCHCLALQTITGTSDPERWIGTSVRVRGVSEIEILPIEEWCSDQRVPAYLYRLTPATDGDTGTVIEGGSAQDVEHVASFADSDSPMAVGIGLDTKREDAVAAFRALADSLEHADFETFEDNVEGTEEVDPCTE